MVAWLDDELGQLKAKLQAAGLDDNTLFVFVIDNGWCNGRVSKGSAFEKGVCTPIFFTWPGKIKGSQRFDQLTSTLDIYPTILAYAGVEVPPKAAGHNLRPQIEDNAESNRKRLYGAIYPAFATASDERPERDLYALYVRDRQWKYIYYLQEVTAARNREYFRIQSIVTEYPTRNRGDQDLFDLLADPYEETNLASDPRQTTRLAEMKADVLAWWKKTGGKSLSQVP